MAGGKHGGLVTTIGAINSLDGVEVTVGVQGTPQTTASGDASPSELVQIAAQNEYGTRSIPSRPFLRTALARHGKKWRRGFSAALVAKARGNDAQANLTLRQVGVVAVADVQQTLRDGPWAPNAPSTVAAKGSDQPLVDTGQLVQSIRAQIEVPGKPPQVIG